ncbi:MAG TPA: DNA-processing protein DprA [Steroidobacteraceae bacterium]|jgi:DNA processing protein|nr:DNA-processing protein DprA [Steroidobacteraceae bacterium]
MDLVDLQLSLGRLPGLNVARLQRYAVEALPACESAAGPDRLLRLYRHSAEARICFEGVDRRQIAEDRLWIEAKGIHLIDLWHEAYPARLSAIPRAPPLLYVQGNVDCLSSPQLAMVGSRRPSISGRRAATEFAASIGAAGVTVTSGLAHGIDAASHEGALNAGGRSIAVLGTGIDQIYPRDQGDLARRIAADGALISELPPRSPPLRRNFPLRNRIISGLSNAVLLVEAAQHSGSLITAQLALEYEKKLFAIPGSIYNPLARGCHHMIRRGALLIESPEEILQSLGIGSPKQLLIDLAAPLRGGRDGPPVLDNQSKILLDAVGFEATSVDELVVRTGLPSQSVASMLLTLELANAVGGLADGRYVRLSSDNHATQRF